MAPGRRNNGQQPIGPKIPPGAVVFNHQPGGQGEDPRAAHEAERAKAMKAYYNVQPDPAEPGQVGFEPIGSQVAMRVHRVEETNTGIELAGSAADSLRTPTADVLECGPDCKQVKPGDVVFVRPTDMFTPMMWEHGRFVIINEASIIGIKRPRGVAKAVAAPAEGYPTDPLESVR